MLDSGLGSKLERMDKLMVFNASICVNHLYPPKRLNMVIIRY
jgi:hypothetical protein